MLLVAGVFQNAHAQDLPILTVQNASAREGNANITARNFVVSLSKPASAPIVVRYATRSQSAVANQDFVPTSATLAIPANTLSASFSIVVKGDLVDENDETFALLFNASNVTLGPTAIGTIRDDDTLFFKPDNVRIVEGDDGAKWLKFPWKPARATTRSTGRGNLPKFRPNPRRLWTVFRWESGFGCAWPPLAPTRSATSATRFRLS